MPRGKGTGGKAHKRPIDPYEHTDKKRINNPPVGLVTPETDPPLPTHKIYDYVTPVPSVPVGRASPAKLDYDPHLDPQLVWAGKKEHTSFEVHTASLHVHERIDPSTIIEAVRKRNGNNGALPEQPSLFERREENPPLREAIDFYKHAHGWSNRLIAGDSLLVMNSLLEKEGMAGQVQMVYIDPPYGKRYNSNFQPFTNKRDVKDGKDEDLTQEPEMIRAFRDTWELEIHSYLTYLRDRLLLAKELLHTSGSCFVQIGDENLHHVRELLDEVFGKQQFCSVVSFKKTGGQSTTLLPGVCDYLLWYARDKERLKYRQLFFAKTPGQEGAKQYNWFEFPDGTRRPAKAEEELSDPPPSAKVFQPYPLVSMGPSSSDTPFEWKGGRYVPSPNRHWSVTAQGLANLAVADRLLAIGNTLRFINYLTDYPITPFTNLWTDTQTSGFASEKLYVVQTLPAVIERCMLLTTDPGDLVLDPTCGSGTTAYVAEERGRRWITCDTSRVALTLAKQRLMATDFDYYELAHPEEGISSGFRYKTAPHATLKSIANNPEIREGMTREQIDAAISRYADQETLYDQPYIDKSRVRVAGPFTVEAVPAPTVRSLEDIDVGAGGEGSPSGKAQQSLADFRHAPTPLLDASIARSRPHAAPHRMARRTA